MLKGFYLVIAAALLASCVVKEKRADRRAASHAHMRHVMTSWKDTPGQRGLMTTAFAEARTAIRQADLAAKKLRRLKRMKRYTRRVVYAINPGAARRKGPGLGYGVLRAARGVATHINLAANSRGSSRDVRFHARHVAAAANNTVARARRILKLAARVRSARSARRAAPYVLSIRKLTRRLINGRDKNRDGKVTWNHGEGGLVVARKHMGFMWKREGLR